MALVQRSRNRLELKCTWCMSVSSTGLSRITDTQMVQVRILPPLQIYVLKVHTMDKNTRC
jgi:hypothetical protein